MNRAARVLHASQPSVVRRVRQLEQEAGAKLFERRSTGVVLTAAGRALLRYVEEIRRLTDEARHAVKRVSGQRGKSVRIGFYQPATTVLVPLLHLLQTEHPEVEVDPIEATRSSLFESLHKGEIDLAFPGFVPQEVLVEFDGIRVPGPIWSYVFPDCHRLARRKRVNLAELKDEKFVSLDEHEFRGYGILLLEHCRLAGFMPWISVYAHTVSEAIAHVIAGRGITLVVRSSIVVPLAAAVTLIDAQINPGWYALWNTSNGNPGLRIIIQLLLDAPPPGWASVGRVLPALGSSRISPKEAPIVKLPAGR